MREAAAALVPSQSEEVLTLLENARLSLTRSPASLIGRDSANGFVLCAAVFETGMCMSHSGIWQSRGFVADVNGGRPPSLSLREKHAGSSTFA